MSADIVGNPADPSSPADLSGLDFLRLIAGDRALRTRLERGERLRAVTPMTYPGRRGPVVIELVPGTSAASTESPGSVRISERGDLLKSLEEQGMDLSVDMILSKTVFHAVKEVEGGGISSGVVYLDSALDSVPADTWRFLQLIVEVIGLRHAKYKDALLRLARREDGPDLIDWNAP
jgi:hypothetical protein